MIESFLTLDIICNQTLVKVTLLENMQLIYPEELTYILLVSCPLINGNVAEWFLISGAGIESYYGRSVDIIGLRKQSQRLAPLEII